MPSKRSATGYFTTGVKAYKTSLKADGWKSEYRSVQKLLNHLARRIKSEGSRHSLCYHKIWDSDAPFPAEELERTCYRAVGRRDLTSQQDDTFPSGHIPIYCL